MNQTTSDNVYSYRYPVSIKGVVIVDDQVPLLKNDRDEWELPGGKLDLDEQPEECVVREIKEELNIDVSNPKIIDSWLYHINPETHVVIVTYGCTIQKSADWKISAEHKQFMLCNLSEIEDMHMPDGYKKSIVSWARML